MSQTMQKLWCQAGGHHWERPSQRGKPPKSCDAHREQPVVIVRPDQEWEVLHCEEGNHEWRRRRAPGRKPPSCPEHRPQPEKPAEGPVRALRATEDGQVQTLHCEAGDHDWERPMTKGPRPKSCPAHSSGPVSSAKLTIRPLVELRADYVLDEESVRIFGYIEAQSKRNRETGDIHHLQEAYNARLRLLKIRRSTVQTIA